jgi:LmbE family N-acetylglucosaminyl deacetylase
MESIVLITAHPDDETTMGGTAWLLKDMFKLHIICCTRGERGIPDTPMDEAGRIREAELREAGALLNAELTFIDRINGDLYADQEICSQVTALVDEIAPRAAFTLWPVDYHPDHSAVSEIARKVFHNAQQSFELVYFEAGYLCQTTHFDPDIYVNITDVKKHRDALMRCHVSQNPDDHLVNLFTGYMEIRGKELGTAYAEAFRSLMPYGKTDKSILFELKEAAEA